MPWRVSTSPRSISVVVERLKALQPIEGLDWNEQSEALTGFTERKSGRKVRVQPKRRTFIRAFYSDDELIEMGYTSEEDFLRGGRDTADIQAKARMAMDVFRDYGLATVAVNGTVVITSAGRAVAEQENPSELILLQFCKMNQPARPKGRRVFPMEVLARALQDGSSYSIEELGVFTLCDGPEEVDDCALPAIRLYREKLIELRRAVDQSKLTSAEKLNVLRDCCNEYFSYPLTVKLDTVFRDYPDAVSRVLQFVGLCVWRGVGANKRIRSAPGAEPKLELLRRHTYEVPAHYSTQSSEDFDYVCNWLGNPAASELPWARPSDMQAILQARITALQLAPGLSPGKLSELGVLSRKVAVASSSTELALLESALRGTVLPDVKAHYASVTAKSDAERREILELLSRIESKTQENRALWLEAATWRALTSLDGAPEVAHGCKFDEHLNPLSFGPGGAASPDMYAEQPALVLVTEVTMLQNNEQWVKEGASVIDHVQNLISRFKDKEVVGAFICPSVYYRTCWQFFILSRESWLGRPIPVVPLTLGQFRGLLADAYTHGRSFGEVTEKITALAASASGHQTYKQWEDYLKAQLPPAGLDQNEFVPVHETANV